MLLSYKQARVAKIIEEDKNISYVLVDIGGSKAKAINYNYLTGMVGLDDIVIINTTAVDLALGTGGLHFIIYNYSNPQKELEGRGHIMKLRYTPLQVKCLAAEEEGSPHHKVFQDFESLDGHIFVLGTLHSMLAPIAAMLNYLKNNIKINYIMTDGGALPIDFSHTVRNLKAKRLISKTITIGHAFGGDLETTNIYTGLIAAKEILKGDVTIITMGPGIVGTGNKYGFSGVEQGHILDAINTLKGRAIVVPRVSFKDGRKRHYGISHQTRTVLTEIAKTAGTVVFPQLPQAQLNIIKEQIHELELSRKHTIVFEDGNNIKEAMEGFGLEIETMGRAYDENKEYFLTLGGVGKRVVGLLNEEA